MLQSSFLTLEQVILAVLKYTLLCVVQPMANMPGQIVYVDHPVRNKMFSNNPVASGIVYEQYSRKVEAPILNYQNANEVSWNVYYL